MTESRVAVSGMIIAMLCAFLVWCTHAWYFEVMTVIGVFVAVFGYAYMDK